MTAPTGIALADTVTTLSPECAGGVLVAGSHGGIVAARYAARARVRAVIFNDAGIGCDEAGVAGLAWLAAHGIAAAAVGHDSARIGDAVDAYAHGRITRMNEAARGCGVVAGQACRIAAERLRAAPLCVIASEADVGVEVGRTVLQPAAPDRVAILGRDSIGLVTAADAGCVLVIGSHGGLHGGDPASALPVAARAAFFHDAGIGKDEAGVTRLPVLAARGMPAGTVGHRSARIGDARSMWASGVLSRVNAPLRSLGIGPGAHVADAARCPAFRPAGQSR